MFTQVQNPYEAKLEKIICCIRCLSGSSNFTLKISANGAIILKCHSNIAYDTYWGYNRNTGCNFYLETGSITSESIIQNLSAKNLTESEIVEVYYTSTHIIWKNVIWRHIFIRWMKQYWIKKKITILLMKHGPVFSRKRTNQINSR